VAGYTIHLTSVGPMSVAPHLVKDLAYDPKRDIAPITTGVVFPNVMVVHTGVPANTLDEFVALAKQKPGQINYASAGLGGAGHLAGELFKERTGINMGASPLQGRGARDDRPPCRTHRHVRRRAARVSAYVSYQCGRVRPQCLETDAILQVVLLHITCDLVQA
jgi:hypothetical protein